MRRSEVKQIRVMGLHARSGTRWLSRFLTIEGAFPLALRTASLKTAGIQNPAAWTPVTLSFQGLSRHELTSSWNREVAIKSCPPPSRTSRRLFSVKLSRRLGSLTAIRACNGPLSIHTGQSEGVMRRMAGLLPIPEPLISTCSSKTSRPPRNSFPRTFAHGSARGRTDAERRRRHSDEEHRNEDQSLVSSYRALPSDAGTGRESRRRVSWLLFLRPGSPSRHDPRRRSAGSRARSGGR
jgi:hypothetical protein